MKLLAGFLREFLSKFMMLIDSQKKLFQNTSGVRNRLLSMYLSNVVLHHNSDHKIASFYRQLNMYGFRRVMKGEDRGSFFHPHFGRDIKDISCSISRTVGRQATPLSSSHVKDDATTEIRPSTFRRDTFPLGNALIQTTKSDLSEHLMSKTRSTQRSAGLNSWLKAVAGIEDNISNNLVYPSPILNDSASNLDESYFDQYYMNNYLVGQSPIIDPWGTYNQEQPTKMKSNKYSMSLTAPSEPPNFSNDLYPQKTLSSREHNIKLKKDGEVHFFPVVYGGANQTPSSTLHICEDNRAPATVTVEQTGTELLNQNTSLHSLDHPPRTSVGESINSATATPISGSRLTATDSDVDINPTPSLDILYSMLSMEEDTHDSYLHSICFEEDPPAASAMSGDSLDFLNVFVDEDF